MNKIKKQYDLYGDYAKNESMDNIQMSGRYTFQTQGLKNTIPNVISRLELNSSDQLLDIGCGAGDLTIPLSTMVAGTTCIDHPAILRRLKQRVPHEPYCYIPGDFVKLQVKQKFSKILAYSVVICLGSKEDVFSFIDKACGLLQPGGRMLIGDFVNKDKKTRFQNSRSGKKFSKAWSALLKSDSINNSPNNHTSKPMPHGVIPQIGDEFICETVLRYRRLGYEVYLLPQPNDLAFGHTREDMLFIKHS